MTQVTVNGTVYSDDGSTANDMLNGGHRTHFLPMISDTMVRVAAAETAASTAINAPGTQGTSTTSITIPTSVPSSKSLTLTQTGKSFAVGQTVKITSQANPLNWMLGDITAFTSGTGATTVNVTYTYGAGTYSDWAVTLSAPIMSTTENAVVALSAAYQMKTTDDGIWVEASGTWSLTYEACATLGNGWYHWIRTAAGSVITLDPNGSETIDTPASATSTTYVLPAGVKALVMCNGTKLTLTIVEGVGDHEVVVHTGNGYGSTNTMIRRFTTILTNTGTAITYADSSTNGASFTINEAGIYSIYYVDVSSASAMDMGVSKNSAQLTTVIESINVANRILYTYATATNVSGTVSRNVLLAAGDVIRPHTDGSAGSSSVTYFAIRKVG